MGIFYHLAERKNLNGILNDGLKTGLELGIQRQFMGIQFDNRYIYLIKNLSSKFTRTLFNENRKEDMSLIEVAIPKEHPIERDYDVSSFIHSYVNTPFLGLLYLLDLIPELGVEPIDGNIDFSSVDCVKDHLRGVDDKHWDNYFGVYRTSKAISAENKCDIRLSDVVWRT